MGKIRAFGSAIVPQVAAEVIIAGIADKNWIGVIMNESIADVIKNCGFDIIEKEEERFDWDLIHFFNLKKDAKPYILRILVRGGLGRGCEINVYGEGVDKRFVAPVAGLPNALKKNIGYGNLR